MKHKSHISRRALSLLLALVLCLGLAPAALAGQVDGYHDPAEHWLTANNRTNELDANATVTRETFTCGECGKPTSFEAFRTPEYTRDGQTAMSRNVKYSDGTMVDGEGKGTILDGTPGVDAYYTGYHFTKAVCENCGTINSNMGKSDYGYGKNVYWLYDCAAEFTEALPETVTYEYTDSRYHTKTTTGGSYCCFCYGTSHEKSSVLERHTLETDILPQPANGRFAIVEHCTLCEYSRYEYVTAKAVIADYYGVVDGQPHTLTVTDLSESGVRTSIRYGNSADACTLTSAPNYTEEGQYTVYYEITYTYDGESMTENGVAYVWLRDEAPSEDGSCGCGCGDPDCGCQDKNCGGSCCGQPCDGHNFILLDSTPASCLTLGYDRYLCTECGKIEKRDYEAALGHAWQGILLREATCEAGGKTVHICHGCGSGFVTDYTAPLGHSWDEGTTVAGASCTGEGVTEYRCVRCGYHRLEGDAANGHVPGDPATCTEPQLCSKCGAVLQKALGHDYKEEVTAPTCEKMGFTVFTCSRCGDSYKGEYTEATGHKAGDWIVDKEPTTTSEGEKHTECVNCGEKLETTTIEKLYLTATTDTHGEAIVGGYLVTVTDTSSKEARSIPFPAYAENSISAPSFLLSPQSPGDFVGAPVGNPVSGAAMALHEDNSISIRLPNKRLLDYADQTTVPGTSGVTNDEGKTTAGYEDADGDRWTLTVKVEDYETGRPIEGAGVSIGKTGNITVTLPDGVDMDENNRITVTITDHKKEPQEGLNVTVKADMGQTASGKTDEEGKVAVPSVAKKERHGAYIVGYGDGTFGPERNMTRSEAAAIFARLLADKNGDTITTAAKTKFTDIPANAWYSGYVRHLSNYDVVYGRGEGIFAPNDAITRAEFTAFAVRFFEAYGDGDAEIMEQYTSFSDVSAGYWAAEYIKDAAARGWIKGYGDGTFRADRYITRAEVVAIVNRLLGRRADEAYIDANTRRLNTFSDMDEGHWAYYDVMEAANTHTANVGEEKNWNAK